jgi:hypothetical protein
LQSTRSGRARSGRKAIAWGGRAQDRGQATRPHRSRCGPTPRPATRACWRTLDVAPDPYVMPTSWERLGVREHVARASVGQ